MLLRMLSANTRAVRLPCSCRCRCAHLCSGVVLVSHDARLILETECELWVCGKQNVLPFDGDFDDYRQAVLEEQERLHALGISALQARKAAAVAAGPAPK